MVVIEATVEAAVVLAHDLYRAAIELGPMFGMTGAPIPLDRLPALRRAHLEAVALAVLRKRAMDADGAKPHRPGRPRARHIVRAERIAEITARLVATEVVRS